MRAYESSWARTPLTPTLSHRKLGLPDLRTQIVPISGKPEIGGEREKKRGMPIRYSGSIAIASTSSNTPSRAKPTTRTLVLAGAAAMFR